MRTLDLDWADLELAFRDATDTDSYLDRDTGEVLALLRGFDDEKDIRDKLKRFPTRFVRIVPVDKGFTRSVLDLYVRQQTGALRRQLDDAVTGPGGIARAMALLHADKPALAAFSRLEQNELVRVVEEFLAAHGVRSGIAPPAPDLFEGLAS